jgi:hypothetical protein
MGEREKDDSVEEVAHFDSDFDCRSGSVNADQRSGSGFRPACGQAAWGAVVPGPVQYLSRTGVAGSSTNVSFVNWRDRAVL